MQHPDQLVVAMAEECRRYLDKWDSDDAELPKCLRRDHLIYMCNRIEKHSEDWPISRLNRWIGFIQCALIANRIIDLAEAKEMFARAKIAYPEEYDEDLLDHLDPFDSFELDIGGPG